MTPERKKQIKNAWNLSIEAHRHDYEQGPYRVPNIPEDDLVQHPGHIPDLTVEVFEFSLVRDPDDWRAGSIQCEGVKVAAWRRGS